eukprot:6188075-Pleurochrysis_carterae.AAC.3
MAWTFLMGNYAAKRRRGQRHRRSRAAEDQARQALKRRVQANVRACLQIMASRKRWRLGSRRLGSSSKKSRTGGHKRECLAPRYRCAGKSEKGQ